MKRSTTDILIPLAGVVGALSLVFIAIYTAILTPSVTAVAAIVVSVIAFVGVCSLFFLDN